jgi:hypothetical protein
MVEMFKEMVEHSKYLWNEDRKEFWDIVLGLGIIIFWFWFSFYVLIPLFG